MSTWGGRRAQGLTRATLATWGTRCHLCGREGATTADHIIPRALGGTDELSNLRPAHASCNSKRQDMPLHRWRLLYPVNTNEIKNRSSRWEKRK
ncbi:TPA: HNH endonuclease [Corynebacterium striatum]|uniref:HNH endonuclease n=1 Tax=Corynebacterium striatum TaxID=43770 RepID=A0ABX7DCN6_CORST|nr:MULTISPECIES: HNH endonuclease signature motif containing protein [Corynebacterium]QQU76456.1 HNH endonuclease [Corynebacterium striatum]HCD1553239.1 HNH endonuclease [Corynebacterium striatum]HCD1825956.1 HNH endonuclease [Corynebacterium striatum]HCD2182108.1 HNH endonuclease [Corynebacterium striatum]HCD2851775.1 HNH endonuclease [Corynebacterium striatum]